jgi:hypothetical protein
MNLVHFYESIARFIIDPVYREKMIRMQSLAMGMQGGLMIFLHRLGISPSKYKMPEYEDVMRCFLRSGGIETQGEGEILLRAIGDKIRERERPHVS